MTSPITPATLVTQDQQQLIGPKVCLMGLGGTGKTYALGTLADWATKNGFELAILFTETRIRNLPRTSTGTSRRRGRFRSKPSCPLRTT